VTVVLALGGVVRLDGEVNARVLLSPFCGKA
jgi:hypothetical protein